MKLVKRDDVSASAYDLHAEVEVRLTRWPDGRWGFDEIVLPSGATCGASQRIFNDELNTWLDAAASAPEGQR